MWPDLSRASDIRYLVVKTAKFDWVLDGALLIANHADPVKSPEADWTVIRDGGYQTVSQFKKTLKLCLSRRFRIKSGMTDSASSNVIV